MSNEKKQKRPITSLYEVIRHELDLEKFELAHLLGEQRQWYTRKKNPHCTMTVVDLYKLYNVSGMMPEEFVKAILRANGER
jgi:hypothetical protein